MHTCPVGCLPWVAVDEELDILRRSRSEITESLSSSSDCGLGGGGAEGVEEGVGIMGSGCDVTDGWFCKTPVQLAETLRLLRRGCKAGRDWDWQIEGEIRCVERGSVEATIDTFLSSTHSRGCGTGLLWWLEEPRERLRWFPLGMVIGTCEGNTANNIREGSSTVREREREREMDEIRKYVNAIG